jgi:hypothetical protein
MQLFLHHLDGLMEPAVLLSASRTHLRIARPGSKDASEFEFVRGKWLGEDASAVSIQFDVPSGDFFECFLQVEAIERTTRRRRRAVDSGHTSRNRRDCTEKTQSRVVFRKAS